MNPIRLSAGRILTIAENTGREAIRQRVLSLLTLVALAFLGGAQLLRQFNFGTAELKFLTDLGLGVLSLFGSILAIVVTAQLFFSEIENRTVLTVLAKPVFRAEFILGKFIGSVAVLVVFTVLIAAALCAVLGWREEALRRALPEAFVQGPLVSYGSVLGVAALQGVKFSVLAAITLLVASYSQTNLFSVSVAFMVLVIGHLQHVAHDAWLRLESPVARVAAGALAQVFPDFQLFNLGGQAAGAAPFPWSAAGGVAAGALIYIVVVLALAVLSFRAREI